MSGDVHAGFCERRRVRLPPATLLVVLCATREQAEQARELVAAVLDMLGLRLHPEKTRIAHLARGAEGFTFLGLVLGAFGRTRIGEMGEDRGAAR